MMAALRRLILGDERKVVEATERLNRAVERNACAVQRVRRTTLRNIMDNEGQRVVMRALLDRMEKSRQ